MVLVSRFTASLVSAGLDLKNLGGELGCDFSFTVCSFALFAKSADSLSRDYPRPTVCPTSAWILRFYLLALDFISGLVAAANSRAGLVPA